MDFSLKQKVKDKVNNDGIEDDIADFLYLIADNTSGDKTEKDNKNRLIRALFREGFEVHDPSGTMKIGSKVIQQALWRVMSKVKFLDSVLHCTGKDENVERLATEGVRTVAKRGDLSQQFSGKAGVFMNSFLYGDGFVMFGKGENEDNPVGFRVLRNEDVYADDYCYGIRGVRPANRLAVIFKYDKDEAYELYPDLEENDVYGTIPGAYETEEDDDSGKQNDIVEVAWAWNKAQKKYIQFAGTQAFAIDRFEGEEYPFVKNNKAYIPVFQFMCQPSEDGFYNYGIGEMVYDLAIITRQLLNMEVGHLQENTYPVTLINAPQAKVDELVEKMAMAQEARVNNKLPFVAMEFSPTGGGQAQAQSLLTQNLFNEWNVIWDRLYRELSRLGINLDDVDRGSGVTRGQVISEEQASNAFIMQMGEYNAPETEEMIECIMDAITEFVSNNNKTPLNLLTTLMMPDGTAQKLEKEITMGMLSKELKDGNWFAVTDKRTGAIPSDLTKMIQEEKLLAMTAPGSPEFNELRRRISMRMGVELTPPQAPAQGMPPQQGGAMQAGAPGEMPVQPPGQNQRVLPDMTGNVMQPV